MCSLIVCVALLGGCRNFAGYAEGADSGSPVLDGVGREDGAPITDLGQPDAHDASPPPPPLGQAHELAWAKALGNKGASVHVGGVALYNNDRYLVGTFEGRLHIHDKVVSSPAGKHALFIYRYSTQDSTRRALWSLGSYEGSIVAVRDAVIDSNKLLVVACQGEGKVQLDKSVPHSFVGTGAALLVFKTSDLDSTPNLRGALAHALTQDAAANDEATFWTLATSGGETIALLEHQLTGIIGAVRAYDFSKASPQIWATTVNGADLRLRGLAVNSDHVFVGLSGSGVLTLTDGNGSAPMQVGLTSSGQHAAIFRLDPTDGEPTAAHDFKSGTSARLLALSRGAKKEDLYAVRQAAQTHGVSLQRLSFNNNFYVKQSAGSLTSVGGQVFDKLGLAFVSNGKDQLLLAGAFSSSNTSINGDASIVRYDVDNGSLALAAHFRPSSGTFTATALRSRDKKALVAGALLGAHGQLVGGPGAMAWTTGEAGHFGGSMSLEVAGGKQQVKLGASAVAADGALYLAGSFEGRLNLAAVDTPQWQSAGGQRVGFVARYEPDGRLGWLRTLSDTAGTNIHISALALDEKDDPPRVFVAGPAMGTLRVHGSTNAAVKVDGSFLATWLGSDASSGTIVDLRRAFVDGPKAILLHADRDTAVLIGHVPDKTGATDTDLAYVLLRERSRQAPQVTPIKTEGVGTQRINAGILVGDRLHVVGSSEAGQPALSGCDVHGHQGQLDGFVMSLDLIVGDQAIQCKGLMFLGGPGDDELDSVTLTTDSIVVGGRLGGGPLAIAGDPWPQDQKHNGLVARLGWHKDGKTFKARWASPFEGGELGPVFVAVDTHDNLRLATTFRSGLRLPRQELPQIIADKRWAGVLAELHGPTGIPTWQVILGDPGASTPPGAPLASVGLAGLTMHGDSSVLHGIFSGDWGLPTGELLSSTIDAGFVLRLDPPQ